MLELIYIYNLFANFGGNVFQQTWIPEDKRKEKKQAKFVNFTFRYNDDALSLSNSTFGDYDDSIQLEIIRDTTRFALQLDLHVEINNKYKLRTISQY